MRKWRTDVALPPEFVSFLETVRSQAGIVACNDDHLTIEFECDDEYDLALMVTELTDSLGSIVGTSPNIERPVEVFPFDPMATSDEFGKPTTCNWCGQSFPTWEEREHHINSDHPLAGSGRPGDPAIEHKEIPS